MALRKKVQLPFVMAVMADLKGQPQEGEELAPRSRSAISMRSRPGTLDSYMAGTKPRASFPRRE